MGFICSTICCQSCCCSCCTDCCCTCCCCSTRVVEGSSGAYDPTTIPPMQRHQNRHQQGPRSILRPSSFNENGSRIRRPISFQAAAPQTVRVVNVSTLSEQQQQRESSSSSK